MQEKKNVRNIDVGITFPDKNSSKQEHDEVSILLYRKNNDNDKIRYTINNYLGIDYDSLSDYQVFVILWLLLKSIEGYTHAKAISGIDIWNMKICMLNNTIVFVDDDGEIIFNEDVYKSLSNRLWDKLNGTEKV